VIGLARCTSKPVPVVSATPRRDVQPAFFPPLSSGRGRLPSQRPSSAAAAVNITGADTDRFLRAEGNAAIDSVAFHYSIYRSLTRFLGLDGNLQVAYDVDVNFVTAWNEMLMYNDMVNPNTNQIDPRHLYGTSNFDVFRWPSLENGTIRGSFATFVATLLMPGIPLVCAYRRVAG
jgi:alpha-1,3-glucan synthase